MQVQIRFKTSGANSVVGGFTAGDVARVSAEFAAHLVEHGFAVYKDAPAERPVETPAPARRGKAK